MVTKSVFSGSKIRPAGASWRFAPAMCVCTGGGSLPFVACACSFYIFLLMLRSSTECRAYHSLNLVLPHPKGEKRFFFPKVIDPFESRDPPPTQGWGRPRSGTEGAREIFFENFIVIFLEKCVFWASQSENLGIIHVII